MNIDQWLAVVGKEAYCNPPTLLNTYELAVKAMDIPGDLCECGVAAGAQIAVMARVVQDRYKTQDHRVIHAFDSYQGLPAITDRDSPEMAQHEGKVAYSEADVRARMEKWGIHRWVVYYHEGWFKDTIPPGNRYPCFPSRLALLRLDGDLYESTKVCLEYLYDLVSPGGYVIIDDYALRGCRDACDEYLHEFYNRSPPEPIEIKGGGGPVWWRKP